MNGIWADFKGDGAGSSTTDPTVTFQIDVEVFNGRGRGTGRTYYPLTFLASKSNPTDPSIPTIFYPASGYRASPSGVVNNLGLRVIVWSSSPNSNAIGYNLHAYYSGAYPTNGSVRVNGLTVRCVRE